MLDTTIGNTLNATFTSLPNSMPHLVDPRDSIREEPREYLRADDLGKNNDAQSCINPRHNTQDSHPRQCLFCHNDRSATLEDNLDHMQIRHGLRIPNIDRLVVDVEYLLGYLHYLIYVLHECIHCHASSRTVQGILQHMTTKGHCQIDLTTNDSEYHDFYDAHFPLTHRSQSAEKLVRVIAQHESDDDMPLDDMPATRASIRASSRTLNRSGSQSHVLKRRRIQARCPPTDNVSRSLNQDSPSHAIEESSLGSIRSIESSKSLSSRAITRQEHRQAMVRSRLDHIRLSDRLAIIHLPLAQQMALLESQRKDTNCSWRSKNHFDGHMAQHGNLKSKERFVNDVPGGKAHKNRFFAR